MEKLNILVTNNNYVIDDNRYILFRSLIIVIDEGNLFRLLVTVTDEGETLFRS